MPKQLIDGRIILGSGRSGTTWILDCLAEANKLRPVFEPLHPQLSEVNARNAYRYIPVGASCPDLQNEFSAWSSGDFRSFWIDYRLHPRSFILRPSRVWREKYYLNLWFGNLRGFFRRRSMLKKTLGRPETLIKCIRANLMAGWLTQTMRFKTILVVRHPCAVVESQYRLKNSYTWDPGPVLERYRNCEELHTATRDRYREIASRNLLPVEALTLNWVIENQLPVEQSSIGGYSVFHYEDLIRSSRTTWEFLAKQLNLHNVPDDHLLSRPSQQSSRRFKAELSSRSARPRWKDVLSREDRRLIQGVLDATEYNLYNTEAADPVSDMYRR